MKRGIQIGIALLAAVLTACQSEREPVVVTGPVGTLTLQLKVEAISTGVPAATRATIPAEADETRINSLYLLFYENRSDGGGTHVRTLTETDLGGTLAMNGSYAVPLGDGITADGTYTILALANLTPGGSDVHGWLDGQSEAAFIGLLEGLTEKQAIARTAVALRGVDIDETDDSRAIRPDNLLMSARTVRRPGEETALVELTRGVARFDVRLDPAVVAPGFALVSASIWGAAPQAPAWKDGRLADVPARMQRFYGLKDAAGFTDGEIIGGLYALENYVASPEAADRTTTAVVLGLKDIADDGFGTRGQTYYYRVNVHPASSAQDLVRNHVYKIRVNSVDALGEDNEYTAWSQSRPRLDVSINEWNVDDNGMVVTDGVNTMVLPVKLVRLDARGDARDLSIFTIGSATLEIAQSDLPAGIGASLSGSLLQITADPLPGTAERRGSIVICCGELRGAISFIQTPDAGTFLSLNRYEIPNHAPTGREAISDNTPFEVTASGPWTARIYNMSDEASNPGFSFSPSGAPTTTLRSTQNPMGSLFQVYTTGDNPSNGNVRNGFMMVTLDEDPTAYSRVVVLAQDPKAEIVFNPAMPSPVRFTPAGAPLGASGYATAETGLVFDVDPGRNASGMLNGWTITARAGDTRYFEVTPTIAGSVNRLTIKAKGTDPAHPGLNLSAGPLTATFAITAGTTTREFIVVQNRMDISVSTRGTSVPKIGGTIDPVTINIDPSLRWIAEIESVSVGDHEGFLSVGGTAVGVTTGPRAASATLSAGFPKIHFPLVGVGPQMTVKVYVEGQPDISTTFVVTQQALNPAPMNILDVRNTSYGSLTGGGHYLEFYRNYLKYAPMFGPTGRVKTAGPLNMVGQSSDPASISSDYVYLHVGGRPGYEYSQARHDAVNRWWERYGGERIVYYFVEDQELFNGARPRATVLSELGITGSGNTGRRPVLNNGSAAVTGSAVYRYIVEDGPFGASGPFRDAYFDGTSTRVDARSLPATAVPLIVDEGNPEKVYLFVDPVNGVIYQGESQIFDIWIEAPATTLRGGSTHDYANLSRFLANLQAWVVNAAQYGTHFTDLFAPGNGELYDKAFN